jgi:hypothetical protein
MTQNQAVSHKPTMGSFGSPSGIEQNPPLRCMRVNELFTPTPEIHLSKITLRNPLLLNAIRFSLALIANALNYPTVFPQTSMQWSNSNGRT